MQTALGKLCSAHSSTALIKQKRFQCLPSLKRRDPYQRSTITKSMSTTGSLTYPKPIVVNAKTQHAGTVIVLHGLGDTGHGWAHLADNCQSDMPHLKFIFPTAPQRRITLNGGARMTGWYDIPSLEEIATREDADGLHESKRYVESLIHAEVDAGIPTDRIVVAGFSQGGAVSLLMLRSELKLAGIIGLSTYLPLRNEPKVVSDVNKDTPILMCHGDADYVVAYQYGVMSYEKLKSLNAKVDFKSYRGMGHSFCIPELDEVDAFLRSRIPTK